MQFLKNIKWNASYEANHHPDYFWAYFVYTELKVNYVVWANKTMLWKDTIHQDDKNYMCFKSLHSTCRSIILYLGTLQLWIITFEVWLSTSPLPTPRGEGWNSNDPEKTTHPCSLTVTEYKLRNSIGPDC